MLRMERCRVSVSLRQMSAPSVTKWVYDFDQGSRDMLELLGGKGANIAEMTRLLGADLIPAGFTITTAACVRYLHDDGVPPDDLDASVAEALDRLETRAGLRMGDPRDPLLVLTLIHI